MSIFQRAAKAKLRFPTNKGSINTEDLYDIPLTTLDKLAVALHTKLESTETKSFLSAVPTSDTKTRLQFEVAKGVLDERLATAATNAAAGEKREQKQRILALIANKQDEQFAGQTIEELTAALDKL